MTANNTTGFLFLKFEDSPIPVFKETRNQDWIQFGETDDYPDYLTKLSNRSAKHNAIINGKVTYIFGNGFQSDLPKVKGWLDCCNGAKEGINDISKKAIRDIEVYGGFYWQIIPNAVGGIAEIYHINYTNFRANKDRTVFYYKNSWKKNSREIAKPYPAYRRGIREISVFSFREYRQDEGVYALPGYISALNWIEADYEVSKQTLSNAKTGFSASKMISFFNGEPEQEEKRDIQRMFNDRATGSDGMKILLSFNNDPTKKPQIDDLGDSDLTKEDFSAVDELITANIFSGHQITTPALFGIKEKAQWQSSSGTELKVGFDIFKNTYVNSKQMQFEDVVNYFSQIMFNVVGLELMDVEPIGFQLDPANFAAIIPKEWVLEKLGIDASKYPSATAGAGVPPPTEPTPGVVPVEKMANETLKNLTGRQYQQISRIVREFGKGKITRVVAALMLKNGFQLTDEDVAAFLDDQSQKFSIQFSEDTVANMFESFGSAKDEFEIIATKDATFEDEEFTFSETFDAVETRDSKDTTGKKILESGSPLEKKGKLPQVTIKYSYEKRPEAAGDKVKATTRAFCRKLCSLNRFYSRADIQQISAAVGFSVWERSGGFWTHGKNDVDPGEHDPRCRHQWKSHIVIKKP